MTLIEKLNRLLHQDIGDIKSDLRAIINEHKAECEPVGVVEYDYYPDGCPKGQWGNITQSFMIAEGTPLFTAPQPTPQDVVDAERWRNWMESKQQWAKFKEYIKPSSIDQAMKGENANS